MSKLVATPEKKPVSLSQVPGSSRLLQRKCACGGTAGVTGECPECRKKRLGLQRFASGPQDSQAVPPIVDDVLRSPGQPLDARTRATMEPGFGHDFSRVRVHTDSRAAESARAVNALAYTVGKDIVFDAGRYAPETNAGEKLLAHELTHVVQQQGLAGSVQPTHAALGQVGDHAEVEAETVAQRVVAGLPAPAVTPLSIIPVQRQEKEKPAAAPLTRAEEIELSRTSPGQVTGSVQPFRLSLHNFAINGAELKDLHKQALQELADLVELTKPDGLLIYIQGHADSSGAAKINDPLSLLRAQAVQKSLEALPGTAILAEGFGETTPLVGNGSVDERSLNRRVDIYLFVPKAVKPPQPGGDEPIGVVPPPTPTLQEDPPVPVQETVEPPAKVSPPDSSNPPSGGEQPPAEKKDFCEDHPILCGALGLGGALAGTGISLGSLVLPPVLYCLLNPSACLPGTRRPDDPQEEPIERRACPIWADLAGSTSTTPPGPLLEASLHYSQSDRAKGYKYIYYLERGFEMKIEFAGHVGGCDCGCGEYKQELRGYFETSDDQGNMQRDAPHAIYGGVLDENEYREDGALFRSLARGLPSQMLLYGDRDVPGFNLPNDRFLPERYTGCTYLGTDAPRTDSFREDQRARMHLEFRGAPVDGCHNREFIPGWPWIYWTVDGEYNPPSAPQKKKPPKSPSTLPPIIVPQITPASPLDDTVVVNGVEIGRQTMDFLEHWQSPDRDLYLPYVLQAIEIEKSRLMMVYARDSGIPSEELLQSAEFDMFQDLAQQTACQNVFTVVDMTDLISVYCEKQSDEHA